MGGDDPDREGLLGTPNASCVHMKSSSLDITKTPLLAYDDIHETADYDEMIVMTSDWNRIANITLSQSSAKCISAIAV